jgi:hypothetical protein
VRLLVQAEAVRTCGDDFAKQTQFLFAVGASPEFRYRQRAASSSLMRTVADPVFGFANQKRDPATK